MHETTFDYVKPTEEQHERMTRVRAAAKEFCDVLERELPDGPDKTYIIRTLRTVSMWAMVSLTRQPDGGPR